MFRAARRNLLWSIRAGRRRLLLFLALLSMGAGLLTSCVGREGPQPQSSAISLLPELPASPPPVPRPARKPAPPSTAGSTPSSAEEATAMAAPRPPGVAPASPSSAPPETEASLGPPGPPPLQTSELIGLDQSAATRLFGPATERSEQPPATVWRYKNASCELDLFFYLDLHSGRMRTLHYALKGDGADTARRQDCLKSLLAERSN